MREGILFPGQGSEELAMGLALARTSPRAARLLALASDAVGLDLLRALDRGGRALEQTEVIQPALVAVGLGAAHARTGASFTLAAGHSLGELAAACFALDVPDEIAIALAALRGRLMGDAARARPGGMLAVRTTSDEALGVGLGLVLASINAPDERVLAGATDAIRAAERSIAGSSRLRVGGPWHSPSMEPAVAPFRVALDEALAARALVVPFYSAITGAAVDARDIPAVLADGLVRPVRWVETLSAIRGEVDALVIAPPARILRGLVRRTLGSQLPVATID